MVVFGDSKILCQQFLGSDWRDRRDLKKIISVAIVVVFFCGDEAVRTTLPDVQRVSPERNTLYILTWKKLVAELSTSGQLSGYAYKLNTSNLCYGGEGGALKLSILECRHGSQRKDWEKDMVETL